MNKLRARMFAVFLAVFGAVIFNSGDRLAFADGEPSDESSQATSQHDPALSGAEKVGADAAVADPRLPPVFPGEEVKDGNERIKVWSTGGPVHVSQPPEPWRRDQLINGNSGVGVIVDSRKNTAGTNQNSSAGQ